MALQIYDKHITLTNSGETVPSATLQVNNTGASTGLATLWQDRAGTIPAANPFTADSLGRVQFYLESGRYTMLANYTGGSISYPDVTVGPDPDDLGVSFDVVEPKADYAALRSTPSTDVAIGDHVYVRGFADPWVKKSGWAALSATDNGWHIVPDDYDAGTNDVYYESTSDIPNVRIFGAIGDGANDDTGAMDACLSLFKSAYFPSGTYNRSGSAFGIDSVNDVFIWGDGQKSKVVRTDVGTVIAITQSNRVVVKDLYVSGIKSYLSGAGCIELENCSRFLVHGNYCTGSSRQGIKISACDYGSVSNNIVTDSYQDGIMIRSGSRWVSVTGNTCFLNGDPLFSPPIGEGIHLFDAQQCTVVGNTCHDNSDHGIAAEGADYCVIQGNICHSNTVSGISATIEGTHKCEGLVVSSNVSDGNGEDGIIIGECDDVTISHNTFANNGRYGVNINAGSSAAQNNITVDTNRVFDNVEIGINVDWNFESGSIKGNDVRGSASVGINLNRSNISDCFVVSNRVRGFATQISDSGTDTRLYDNDVGNKLSGRVTLSSGTFVVTFSTPEPSSGFVVALNAAANETVYVTGKSTMGFTINSSNVSSTAQVDWRIVDSKV